MSQYTFIWEHPADDVHVTGTFDDWRKTVKLEKEGSVFKKTIELPKVHTQYKFVVDGNWCINESARKEDNGAGITNNVLLPEDFVDGPVGALSSVGPDSTTAALAGAVPKVERMPSIVSPVPGAFPMTPTAETPGGEPRTFHINPIPATEGPGNPIQLAPGEPVPDPSTLTHNTVQSTVKDDEDLHTPSRTAEQDKDLQTSSKAVENDKDLQTPRFAVAPIPATAGAGNPIQLAAGEKVPDPSTFTSNTIQSTVRTDASSYQKPDALPPMNFTPQAERDARGGMFDLPPVSGNMIPESSLPMGVAAKTEQDTGMTIQSAAPNSTTAALAGAVPKEPRSVREAARQSPRATEAVPEASVHARAEQRLADKTPEASTAAHDKHSVKAVAGTAAAGVTAGAGAVAAAMHHTRDKVAESVGGNSSGSRDDDKAKAKAPETSGLNGSVDATATAAAGDVPVRVVESQKEAHVSPEAASNEEAVHEKSRVEQELLSAVPKATGTGTAAPAIAVPALVSDSQKEAQVSAEAAAYSEAVAGKKAVERELLHDVPKASSAGEPAPVLTAATTAVAPGSAKEGVESEVVKKAKVTEAPLTTTQPSIELNAPASAAAQPATSKTVGGGGEVVVAATTAEQSQPTVTTGIDTATTEAQSSGLATPTKGSRRGSDVSPKRTPGSESVASGATDKKKKRRSIFGKLKEKFSHKHDE